jgi:hypothetical protein
MNINQVKNSNLTISLNLSAVIQLTILLGILGLVLWTVLFSNYPLTHDFFHQLRHALFIVPCH